MAIAQSPIDDARAAELQSAGLDGATGVRGFLAKNTPVSGAQELATKYCQTQYHLCRAIEAILGGAVLSKEDGLKVIVKGGKYLLGGSTYTLPDTDPFTCSDDSTCYLYCDGDEVVEESTTAWPGTAHWKLAIVTTADGAITSILPCQHLNFDPTGSTPWYQVAAAAAVNMAGYGLTDLGELKLKDPSTLTIADGVITPTLPFHVVAAESGVTDDLDTITADAEKVGRLLVLMADAGDTIAMTSAGNIQHLNHTTALKTLQATAAQYTVALLLQSTATKWVLLGSTDTGLTSIVTAVAVYKNPLTGLGRLNFTATAKTISGGSIAYSSGGLFTVATEGAAGTDDLDTMTGGVAGDVAILVPAVAGKTVVVKHGTGAGNFKFHNAKDFIADSLECRLVVQHNGTVWEEVAHAPSRMRDVVAVTPSDEDRCIPYSPGPFVVPGALSAGVQDVYVYCPVPFTLENISAYAVTAPSGGSCIVDIQDDGASIFSGEGEMADIRYGTNSATSTTKSHKVAAGSWLRIEIKSTGSSPNGAADLTVTVNGYANAQTSPHA